MRVTFSTVRVDPGIINGAVGNGEARLLRLSINPRTRSRGELGRGIFRGHFRGQVGCRTTEEGQGGGDRPRTLLDK